MSSANAANRTADSTSGVANILSTLLSPCYGSVAPATSECPADKKQYPRLVRQRIAAIVQRIAPGQRSREGVTGEHIQATTPTSKHRTVGLVAERIDDTSAARVVVGKYIEQL